MSSSYVDELLKIRSEALAKATKVATTLKAEHALSADTLKQLRSIARSFAPEVEPVFTVRVRDEDDRLTITYPYNDGTSFTVVAEIDSRTAQLQITKTVPGRQGREQIRLDVNDIRRTYDGFQQTIRDTGRAFMRGELDHEGFA